MRSSVKAPAKKSKRPRSRKQQEDRGGEIPPVKGHGFGLYYRECRYLSHSGPREERDVTRHVYTASHSAPGIFLKDRP